jgi:L-aspartate oxidase
MAYRAGAWLEDMEFIQFHPTAFCSPGGGCFLISEAVRGEGAVIVNRKGERFLFRYHPAAELAPRDVVARALFREMRETGEPVYIDLRPVEGLLRRFPHICERLRHQGLDPEKELIPVTPAAHYLMGGVKTDLDGYTGIPGLYACGEAACTGVHGANRLASNSLLEGAVFGARIARALARCLPPPLPPLSLPQWKLPRIQLRARKAARVRKIWRRLQEIMWEKVGLERVGRELREAWEEMRALRASLGPPETREEKELENLLTVARVVARAALVREQRGPLPQGLPPPGRRPVAPAPGSPPGEDYRGVRGFPQVTFFREREPDRLRASAFFRRSPLSRRHLSARTIPATVSAARSASSLSTM